MYVKFKTKVEGNNLIIILEQVEYRKLARAMNDFKRILKEKKTLRQKTCPSLKKSRAIIIKSQNNFGIINFFLEINY